MASEIREVGVKTVFRVRSESPTHRDSTDTVDGLSPSAGCAWEALIEVARRQMERRDFAAQAAGRYGLLSDEFKTERVFDRSGLLQCLLEIESPTGILPPAPPTPRGKLGHAIVRLQAKILWWVVRALRLNGRGLRAAYDTMFHEHQRLTRHEATQAVKIAEIEQRLDRIEQHLNCPGMEHAEP